MPQHRAVQVFIRPHADDLFAVGQLLLEGVDTVEKAAAAVKFARLIRCGARVALGIQPTGCPTSGIAATEGSEK